MTGTRTVIRAECYMFFRIFNFFHELLTYWFGLNDAPASTNAWIQNIWVSSALLNGVCPSCSYLGGRYNTSVVYMAYGYIKFQLPEQRAVPRRSSRSAISVALTLFRASMLAPALIRAARHSACPCRAAHTAAVFPNCESQLHITPAKQQSLRCHGTRFP